MSMEIYGVSVQTFMLISEKNVNAVSIGDSTKLNQLRNEEKSISGHRSGIHSMEFEQIISFVLVPLMRTLIASLLMVLPEYGFFSGPYFLILN